MCVLFLLVAIFVSVQVPVSVSISTSSLAAMLGWQVLWGSNSSVSFAKETYTNKTLLSNRPSHLRSLLIFATPPFSVSPRASTSCSIFAPLRLCVAVCCSLLQCIAVCCGVLWCIAVCGVLHTLPISPRVSTSAATVQAWERHIWGRGVLNKWCPTLNLFCSRST